MENQTQYNVKSKEIHGLKVKEYVPKRTPEEEQKFSQKVTQIVYNVLRQHGRVP
ncbi:MAG: hypothetical protein IJM51_05645 [Clostridia bacterium]|nr:hypothetical protein [Clostridia bacterium]